MPDPPPRSLSLWSESNPRREAGALSPGLPVVKVLVTFKASRRDPHCQGTFSEAQHRDILDLEIPRQIRFT